MRLWSPRFWRMFFAGSALIVCFYVIAAAWQHNGIWLTIDLLGLTYILYILHCRALWEPENYDEDSDDGNGGCDTEPIMPTPYGDLVEEWLRDRSRQGV